MHVTWNTDEQNARAPKEWILCWNCGCNPCQFQCVNSPHYYSPEREREDALFHDSLSHDEWFRLAISQYEMVHGEPYVS